MTLDHTVAAEHCLNCGAVAAGHYCQDCGQHTQLHVPSAAEFLHEFVGHYVALEGKLWGTVRRLLFHPGALTNDYIAGRRVRYVEPLRIYLTFSILFFALFKLPGHELKSQGALDRATLGATLRHEVAAAPAAPPAPSAPARATDAGADTATGIGSGLGAESTPAWLAARLQHIEALPLADAGKLAAEGFLHYAPYAMFLLMPVFALYLKLLYLGSGRRYGEHVLFALHSNAFAFLAFGLIMLAPFDALQTLLLCWMVAYLPWAMRRVYGGTWWGTLVRWLTLITLHLLTMALAMAGVLALSLSH